MKILVLNCGSSSIKYKLFGNKIIKGKIREAERENIKPILCVGFGIKKQASDKKIKEVIKKQLGAASKDIIIAYEPVWAIGTGKAVKGEHAGEIAEFIKSKAKGAKVLYGGSVSAENSKEFAKIPELDGVLVGRASIEADNFIKIIKSFSNN